MLVSTSSVVLTWALVATAHGGVIEQRQTAPSPVPAPAVVDAIWDGKCTYPRPTANFSLPDYLGRWYQQAGTPFLFTTGCKCITADYGMNDDGTVSVLNRCELLNQKIDISGSAAPAPEAYGETAAFVVTLNPQSEQECAGPNYIVQETNDIYSIVQSANFETMFLLSRIQDVPSNEVDNWIRRAGELGTNVTNVIKYDQMECKFSNSTAA
ncbi:Calycin-like protein [Aulographum hederae CBS 113979]|uniref:Calycin-like protein n=1 Tax=Aulographum hederae CBS 113979 TaxID=1176131 RepID=A0A6G1H0Q4_9PEZI|nr:Calycin-like protein [Aulographum hederae CBS 113979]